MKNSFEAKENNQTEIQRSGQELSQKKINKVAKVIGVVVVAAATIAGAYIAVKGTNDSLKQRFEFVADLKNPKALEASGACVAKLGAETQFLWNAASDLTKPGTFTAANYKAEADDMKLRSSYYASSLNLAAANHILCSPSSKTAMDLTPDFSISGLKCVTKLAEEYTYPDSQPNDIYKHDSIIHDDKINIEEALASQLNIPCN
jgi:uncharacterized protein YneF (UPF0154 family)